MHGGADVSRTVLCQPCQSFVLIRWFYLPGSLHNLCLHSLCFGVDTIYFNFLDNEYYATTMNIMSTPMQGAFCIVENIN